MNVRFIRYLILFFSFMLPFQTIAMNGQVVSTQNKNKKNINMLRLTGKLAAGITAGLLAHCCLEFISTGAHEMGHSASHALSGNGISPTKINFTGSLLVPWRGITHYINNKPSAITTAVGPAIGILTTYLQLIGLEKLEAYVHKKTESEKPLSFFSRYTNGVKNISAHVMGKKIDDNFTEPSLASVIIGCIKWFRWSRIVGESIYGFTPLEQGKSTVYDKVIRGDGERIWKKIFGEKSPKYNVNLPLLVAISMSLPICIGFGKSIAAK